MFCALSHSAARTGELVAPSFPPSGDASLANRSSVVGERVRAHMLALFQQFYLFIIRTGCSVTYSLFDQDVEPEGGLRCMYEPDTFTSRLVN